jgi:SHS2 domain-containing protein
VICDSGFELFDHTADVGLRVWSKDWKELFELAAKGMTSIIVDPISVNKKEKKSLQLEGNDLESLFITWLREILYMIEKGMVFSDFQVQGDVFSHKVKENYMVRALLLGEKIDLKRHDICTEIKAITRHGLSISKSGDHWKANIIFDV